MAKDENNAQEAQEGDAKKDPNAELYEPPEPKTIIRVITVVSYLCSVSFMGVALSAYYIFLWEPPNPRLIQRTHHLSADPQAEPLIGEPRLNLTHSDETYYSDYLSSNLLDDSPHPRNDGNDSEKSIRGRKMNDNFPENGSIGNQPKPNASHVLLRNSLIDILKGNRVDVSETHLIENDETKKSYEKVTADAKVGSDASLTVDVPLRTISGNESSPRINHLAHHSLAPTDFTDGAVERPINTVSPPGKRRKKKKFRRREAPNDPNDDTSLTDKILRTNKDQLQETDQVVPPGWQASSPKLISIAITHGDTQIDTGTKASMMEDYHSGELEASSPRTESSIPTTLAESVLFGRIYSTSTTWSDSEDTQPSSTPETIENNATEQSVVFSIE